MFPKQRKHHPPQTAKIFQGVRSRYLIITFKTIFILAILSLLGLLGFWVFTGDLFKIKNISCQQKGLPCDEKIITLFQEALGQNIFLLKTRYLQEKIIKMTPQYRRINIQKRLPETLVITIMPREPFAKVEASNGKQVMVDEEGRVLETTAYNLKLPKLLVYVLPQAYDQLLVDQKLIAGLELIKLLQNSYLNFEYISYPNETTLTVIMSDRVIASFSAQKDLNTQVDSLQYILRHSRMKDKEIRTIDLRFQKPIITFK